MSYFGSTSCGIVLTHAHNVCLLLWWVCVCVCIRTLVYVCPAVYSQVCVVYLVVGSSEHDDVSL